MEAKNRYVSEILKEQLQILWMEVFHLFSLFFLHFQGRLHVCLVSPLSEQSHRAMASNKTFHGFALQTPSCLALKSFLLCCCTF